MLAALLVLILATIAAGIATAFDWEFGKTIVSAWPIVVLVVLGLFLALQLLPLLMTDRRREPPAGTPTGSGT